jgi:hypothetical protein
MLNNQEGTYNAPSRHQKGNNKPEDNPEIILEDSPFINEENYRRGNSNEPPLYSNNRQQTSTINYTQLPSRTSPNDPAPTQENYNQKGNTNRPIQYGNGYNNPPERINSRGVTFSPRATIFGEEGHLPEANNHRGQDQELNRTKGTTLPNFATAEDVNTTRIKTIMEKIIVIERQRTHSPIGELGSVATLC